MKPIDQLLSHLRALNIRLKVEGNHLRYQAPPGVLTSDLRAQLSKRKAEILMALHEADIIEMSIAPLKDRKKIPLSFCQQRLWFLDQLKPGSNVYNIPIILRIKNVIDIRVLDQSLHEIVRRHEALRTTFASNEDQGVQKIAPQWQDRLKAIDLREWKESQCKAESTRLVEEEVRKSFDLRYGPLMRATILIIAENEHILILTMHHIISDGWSLNILMRELSILYEAYLNNKPSPLPELSIQYADYAVWQREKLQGLELERQLRYWKEKMRNAAETLELPYDHPRPTIQNYQGNRERISISREIFTKLKNFSQEQDVTLFMTLLTVFKILLYRYTSQIDIVVATPIAGRERVEIEGLIGFFVNTLVLRTDLGGNPVFEKLLQQVKETALGAYAHQGLPFDRLVEELQPGRDLSRSPLFQVMFVMENVSSVDMKLTGALDGESLDITTGTSKFDLTLSLIHSEDELAGWIEYSTDLFNQETILRMIEHFKTLISGILNDPDRRIDELPILTKTEEQQILVEWNENRKEYPQSICIHELFEGQVSKKPEAVAVIYEDQFLCYEELNRRANRLAHALVKLGIGPERIVGIYMERSLKMMIGMLGVLKAGGAYTPLDLENPRERLLSIIEDSCNAILIDERKQIENLQILNIPFIVMDGDENGTAFESSNGLPVTVRPENMAYVIYTSGSTGLPKGVSVEHRQLVNYLTAIRPQLQLPPDAHYAFVSTFAADLGHTVVFSALCNGGHLHVISDEKKADPGAMKQYFSNHFIDCLKIVPSHLVALETAEQALLPRRMLILGGEASKLDWIKRLQDSSPDCAILNHYGPTESTVGVLTHREQPGRRFPETVTLLLGRPLANIDVYVLDCHLNPVPIGVPGELYIGGAGLSRGYLHRPDLTADHFYPHIFSAKPGQRLYRTGDLVRYHQDGNLEFLGRIDHQIKIRGYRVETGEIETILAQHPDVGTPVVVVLRDNEEEGRLAAYVTARGKEKPNPNALRNFLKKRLPDYMIPVFFTVLESLPLTSNGKVNRKALPLPEFKGTGAKQTYVAPRTILEKEMAEIWSRILGVEHIGIHDNFFELGGHSLLAIRVISRLRQVFQVELPIRALFEETNISGLAKRIETAMMNEDASAFPILPVKREGKTPLSFAQERLWFLDQLEPGLSAYNIPMALRVKGGIDFRALENSFFEIVNRHESLRTTFRSHNGLGEQVIRPRWQGMLSIVDLQSNTGQREEETRRLIKEEAQRSFDLERGPLLRVMSIILGEEECVLILNMHHIVSDGWSRDILMRELRTIYESFSKNENSPNLEALPIQYADFAVWQRERLRGRESERHLKYWKGKLQGAPLQIELPTDRPRPPVQSHRGSEEEFTLSREQREGLELLSQKHDVTLFMALLAAFKVLLYRYTSQADILVGIPMAGRNRAEIEGLIGFFVNTLVLRTDLGDQPGFHELLSRVKETALGAYAHQDLPFEKLVEELHPERDLSRSPLFQVMFALQNMPVNDFELYKTQILPLESENKTTKFDLSLIMATDHQKTQGWFEYSTDLFERETILRMIGHFKTLVNGILANPEHKISELPLLTREEERQILVEWNDTSREYPQHEYIHNLFERQAQRTPEAAALVFEGQCLSYGELNRLSNRLAHYLRKRGIGPEILVGTCLERSLEMVIALLGILKAGGAYVPLDPGYPRERRLFMIADSKVRVLLTQSSLFSSLSLQDSPLQIVCLDSDRPEMTADDPSQDENPVSGVGADHMAYMIYTSGSTGQPKGAVNTHGAILNRLQWMQAEYALDSDDRILQKTPFSFDVSVWEFFWPLMTGASLVIARPEGHKDSEYLVKTIQEEHVTTIHFVPSMLQVFVEERGIEEIRSLKRVICSGEALPAFLLQQWFARSKAGLHNLYGPTEAAVDVTCWPCREDWKGLLVPIGRPIANTQIYLLDSSLRPLPIGIPGELYIGGAGLARGYLDRPDLTAEKFIPHPHSHESGARLYKTGDLARYSTEGQIEFLGRSDHQVKIRGFRIELEEIEAALTRHAQIREAIVVAQGDTATDRHLAAYLVPVNKETIPDISDLCTHLKAGLPGYMVPSEFMTLDSLPLTPNGKVDRKALPIPDKRQAGNNGGNATAFNEAEKKIMTIWREILGIEGVGIHDNFFDLGGHSLLVLRVHQKLRTAFTKEIAVRDLFRYTTIAALAQYFETTQASTDHVIRRAVERASAHRSTEPSGDIAIIGMAGRFPGAPTIEAFWENLKQGKESITFFTDEELLAAGVRPEWLKNPRYVKALAVMPDIDRFDAQFFGVNPREAEMMDPQQRLFLEYAWQALEGAGYDPEQYPKPVGVFAGASDNTYLLNNLFPNQKYLEIDAEFQTLINNCKDFMTTQASYKLNLTGPSMTIQTACSTSLVAVYEACQSLLNQKCDMALAGGISLSVPQVWGYFYTPGGIKSPDGHCRPYDAEAQGIVGGHGIGLVVLKRLNDAMKDGDTIHAVIKGAAINNDGARKVGYTAPSEDGQVEVITEALTRAKVHPGSITYVEGHGTGTPLGDPIEVAALTRSFRYYTQNRQFCALGSVKANIGHLDTAAGIVGLIKTVLCLRHKQLVPSLHFRKPNPALNIEKSPFFVNTELCEWKTNGQPRRAGVSSFGIGGTNAHIILEEPPSSDRPYPGKAEQLVVLSAKTAEALEQASASLADFLRQYPETNLADAAHTLQVGRKPFEYRRTLVCSSTRDAVSALETNNSERVYTFHGKGGHRPLYFMFPGQGSQYVNMGRGLYKEEEVFREEVDRCARLLQAHLDMDLKQILYPSSDAAEPENEKRLEQTALAQPALFVIEYALSKLWMAWGLSPKGMIGHSIGEYVAACLSGVFSLEEALFLVAQRGQLMQSLPKGSMLGVPLSEAEIRSYVEDSLSVAAVNGPKFCTLSGPDHFIRRLELRLKKQNVLCRRLHTSHAFHSAMVDSILDPFRDCFHKINLQSPRVPFVSNVTGTWIKTEEATDPAYWVKHLRQTVRFGDGLGELLKEPDSLLLETGPGRTLGVFAKQQKAQAVVHSLRHPEDKTADRSFLLNAMGRLWLYGLNIDWPGFYNGERRRRIPLPTYPFARQCYWVKPAVQQDSFKTTRSLHKKSDMADWFYLPCWKPSVLGVPVSNLRTWLILGDEPELAEKLRVRGQTVYMVRPGKTFRIANESRCRIDPQQFHDYVKLLKMLHPFPQCIIFRVNEKFNFLSLIFLLQALAHYDLPGLQLNIITQGAQQVNANEEVDPDQALVLGAAAVIPHEYPALLFRCIDFAFSRNRNRKNPCSDDLLRELLSHPHDPVVAYRDFRRWVRGFEPVKRISGTSSPLRNGGVYLLLGGLGQIGLSLAGYLAEEYQAKLILTNLPGSASPKERQRTATHDPAEPVPDHILLTRDMESQGAEVLILNADVANYDQMKDAIKQVLQRFGTLNGVVYLAGIPLQQAFKPIKELTASFCKDTLRPEVQGLKVLDEVLREQNLDFCLFFSSLSTTLGSYGLSAHAAANRFMEAFIQQKSRGRAAAWRTVNWDKWTFEAETQISGMEAGVEEPAMSPDEGWQAFKRVLSLEGAVQIIHSITDLQSRWEKRSESKANAFPPAVIPKDRYNRSYLQNPYVAPHTEVQIRLAEIWQEFLGIEEIGIHDNFMELGGHSLLATQVISKVRQLFQMELSIRNFFEMASIDRLSRFIDDACWLRKETSTGFSDTERERGNL